MSQNTIRQIDSCTLAVITGGNGGPPPPRPAPPKPKSSVDGAVCRAAGWAYYPALGAAIGSFFPGVGTLVGGALGGAVASLATEGCPD